MNPPCSDELNIGYLSRLFDDTTNCYKFFWFLAILRKVDATHQRFTFNELIDEMICDAWYMVTEFHLRLGPMNSKDNLEEVVKYIHDIYGFRSSEKKNKLLEFLQKTDDKKIREFKSLLTQNVPFRLQSPFYDEITIARPLWNGSKDVLAKIINNQKQLIYYFVMVAGLGTMIEITPEWAEYLIKHEEILRCWAQLKLIQYLQKRNPNVPGIPDKIGLPESRNIDRVRKYWELIAKKDPKLKDIYGKNDLVSIRISVDHFVPWQYVAHDELWNLHPTTKSINSSKNNSLADWSKYFDLLGDIEYRAYELRAIDNEVAKCFNKIADYHLNNTDIRNQLYANGLSKPDFKQRLENVIWPVYESAKHQGFREWSYRESDN